MSDYWFFLSYSRADDDAYLQQFFVDLAQEVRGNAGLKADPDEIGFFDQRGIEVGDTWDAKLADAIQTSRVMICMYTNGYFKSDWCGKEFHIFRSRIDEYVKSLGQKILPPRLIIPVLWRPPNLFSKSIPTPLADLNIQYTHAELGETYAREGLRQLVRMKDSKYRDEYGDFLQRIAIRIYKEAEPRRLMTLKNLQPLREVMNAFIEPSAELVAPTRMETNAAPENIGPRVAQFVFIAGRSTELQSIRPAATGYGSEGGRDWRPWDPPDQSPVGILAQKAAVEENVFYEHLPIDDNLIDQLRKAEATNTMVVMVVDPWTIQIPSYREKMHTYDKNNFVNCAVVIPWCEKDQSDEEFKMTLINVIQATFFRSSSNTTYFRDQIVSSTEFHQAVSSIVCEIRRRLMQRAQVYRQVQSNQSLPIITGPGVP